MLHADRETGPLRKRLASITAVKGNRAKVECDSCPPKCLLWAERPHGWRCSPNVPKKQWKDQVAADVSTHLTRCLYRDALQGDSCGHDGWARCLTGVAVWHHWHQVTSWWF